MSPRMVESYFRNIKSSLFSIMSLRISKFYQFTINIINYPLNSDLFKYKNHAEDCIFPTTWQRKYLFWVQNNNNNNIPNFAEFVSEEKFIRKHQCLESPLQSHINVILVVCCSKQGTTQIIPFPLSKKSPRLKWACFRSNQNYS